MMTPSIWTHSQYFKMKIVSTTLLVFRQDLKQNPVHFCIPRGLYLCGAWVNTSKLFLCLTRTNAVTLTGSPTRSTTRRTTAVLLSLTTNSVWPRNRSVADSHTVPGMDRARINPASRRTGSIPGKGGCKKRAKRHRHSSETLHHGRAVWTQHTCSVLHK